MPAVAPGEPRTVETRRVRGLAVYERPSSPPGGSRLVLVHGAMDRGASFVKLIRHLPDLSAVRYDRRGYGRSVDAGVAPTVDAHADDLLAVLDGQPALVLGHSFGAVVALAAASTEPSLVQGVVAFEPPVPWEPWWPEGSAGGQAVRAAADGGPGAAAERFMRRIVGEAVWDGLPEGTKQARRAEGPALLAELGAMRDLDRPPYDVEHMGPLLVAHGSDTDERHVRAARALAAAAGAPLAVVEGARHGAHTSHPAELAALVLQLRHVVSAV